MGRGDSEKILQAYLEDILWHSEDVADTRGSYQSKTQLINLYYKANDKHKAKRVHLRALYENILANIDVLRNLKQELEKSKTKSEDIEQALKICQESREYYKAKCKTILAVKYTPNFETKGLPEDILEIQNKQIEDLSKRCQQTRENVANLRKTSENIKIESRRMRRKFTSLRQKYATALRHSGRAKKLKRYSNTLTLNENPDEDWVERDTQTDVEEPTKLEEENKELKEAYQNLREEHEELALTKEKLEDRFNTLNEKFGHEAKERENLQREIEDCEEELTIWEKRCKNLTDTCNRLKESGQNEKDLKQTYEDQKGASEIETSDNVHVKEDKETGLKQLKILNEISELHSSFGNCEDRLISTSNLKKEMIRIHGKGLQELVATNKKLSKVQRNDDDSKHQQQEFKRNLNRGKGDIKILEEDNDGERLGKINEVKYKFEEELARIVQETRETLQKLLEDSERNNLLSQKYQELMSIMREENNRLKRFSYDDEINREKKFDEEPNKNSKSYEEVKDTDDVKEKIKKCFSLEVSQDQFVEKQTDDVKKEIIESFSSENNQDGFVEIKTDDIKEEIKENFNLEVNQDQFSEINTEMESLENTLKKFDGTETDEVRRNLKRQFLEIIGKINGIKVNGDESVRKKKIEAIKRLSKCVEELEKGGNH